MKSFTIKEQSEDSVINVALDTLEKTKQALIFVNTKRSAEKAAEDIARFLRKEKKLKESNAELSEKILHALQKPTKQCERLADLIKYSVAFHHAGLTNKQKELIEDNFRTGNVKLICCTPTLAAGVDLPAFRTIIRDLKRFGMRGMTYIPVLEYLQMAGRAGRPRYDTEGESIIITSSENEKEEVTEKYVDGIPEDITSKLAVEPVLRTYVLSLIATNFVNSRKALLEFFSKTFWAYQFEDMNRLEKIMDRMIELLKDFEFIETKSSVKGFVSADEIEDQKITATEIGRRVAQLYIDPLTAHNFLEGINKSRGKVSSFALLQMISYTLELRPLLRTKVKEYSDYESILNENYGNLISEEIDQFDEEYDEYIDSVKTASFFMDWMDEKDDEYLLEKYDARPGETRAKLDLADWLVYSAEELAKLTNAKDFARDAYRIRYRLRYGVKEELLTLLKLNEIGRVRARRLFSNGIKDLGDVKKADFAKLKQLLGESVAKSIKEQVGEKVDVEIKETKRKGQMSIEKYRE